MQYETPNHPIADRLTVKNGTVTDLSRHKHSDPVTGAYQTDAIRYGIGNSAVSSN